MKTGIVYKVTNLITGKSYIGSTYKNIEDRWIQHVKESGTRCKVYLHKAIKKYGHNNFKIEEICSCLYTESNMFNLEDYFIDYCNTLNPNGYNLVYANRGVGSRPFISAAMKSEWETNRESRMESVKNRKIDPEIEKDRIINSRKAVQTLENKERASEHSKNLWESGAMQKNAESTKADWAKPEQRKKRVKAMRDGSAHRFKAIVSVSIFDGSVTFYENVHDVLRAGFSSSCIYACLNKEAKTGQKYCWFYKDSDDQELYKKHALELVGSFKTDWARPILKTDPNTFQETEYPSINDIVSDGFKPKEVARVLRGDRKMAGGYYWKFKA